MSNLDEKSKESLLILKSFENFNEEIQLSTIKHIKNSIIGNKKKKLHFLSNELIELLVNIISKTNNDNLIIQCTSIIGSVANTVEGSKKINSNNGIYIKPLVTLLSNSNQKIVESSLRAIKILSMNSNPPMYFIHDSTGINLLISLLKYPLESVNDFAAIIIAKICEYLNEIHPQQLQQQQQQGYNNRDSNEMDTSTGTTTIITSGSVNINYSLLQYQNIIHSKGGLKALLYLFSQPKSKLYESILLAIGWLTKDNVLLSSIVMNSELGSFDLLVTLFKTKGPKIKLLAVNCICNLNQSKVIPESYSYLIRNILPTIIRLMGEEDSIQEDAPIILARLISDNEDLQRVASEAEAISRLGQFLKDVNSSDRLKINSLSAIAVLCSMREESRKQVSDAKIIPQITSFLQSDNYAIRAASCRLTKSLSRSIKHLRTSLFDCTIAVPLLKLLDDKSLEVQVSASATLCNLILDFSPMKQTILDNGGVKKLVDLTQSTWDFQLRLNCVWAIKNLLFMAEPSLKESVMKQFTYQKLISLLKDYEPPIVEQALSVLRNLAYKDQDQIVSDENFDCQLIPILESKLQSEIPEIIQQALFVICNIVGNEKQRSAVMKSPIVLKLINFMDHKSSEIRVAVVWCISNLLSPEDPIGLSSRISRLKELGYQKKLESLIDDQHMEVKDRVKTALNIFEKQSSTHHHQM
ncbi:armadillo repeat-containing protein [Tieghemostelium lacteum]|uniref:Armadillo repeat-containing protein n=1 Tax=Tieghemostelium lacteum TaxID=361077 RepID=A0A152A3J8_TIELA|nr:armadillo repeat-containing protein [Tieghemostelium lacteum]|eukprot:KYR00796.1 armadillo repeat-containing protein [Tieghemostelium lacteum]